MCYNTDIYFLIFGILNVILILYNNITLICIQTERNPSWTNVVSAPAESVVLNVPVASKRELEVDRSSLRPWVEDGRPARPSLASVANLRRLSRPTRPTQECHSVRTNTRAEGGLITSLWSRMMSKLK